MTQKFNAPETDMKTFLTAFLGLALLATAAPACDYGAVGRVFAAPAIVPQAAPVCTCQQAQVQAATVVQAAPQVYSAPALAPFYAAPAFAVQRSAYGFLPARVFAFGGVGRARAPEVFVRAPGVVVRAPVSGIVVRRGGFFPTIGRALFGRRVIIR